MAKARERPCARPSRTPAGWRPEAGSASRPAEPTPSTRAASPSKRPGTSAAHELGCCAALRRCLLDLVDLGAEPSPDRRGRGLARRLHGVAGALAAGCTAGGGEALLGQSRE